jgi:hypothetical protein
VHQAEPARREDHGVLRTGDADLDALLAGPAERIRERVAVGENGSAVHAQGPCGAGRPEGEERRLGGEVLHHLVEDGEGCTVESRAQQAGVEHVHSVI